MKFGKKAGSTAVYQCNEERTSIAILASVFTVNEEKKLR
jgi:hypothetical protein